MTLSVYSFVCLTVSCLSILLSAQLLAFRLFICPPDYQQFQGPQDIRPFSVDGQTRSLLLFPITQSVSPDIE
jgi:hypothetical protein